MQVNFISILSSKKLAVNSEGFHVLSNCKDTTAAAASTYALENFESYELVARTTTRAFLNRCRLYSRAFEENRSICFFSPAKIFAHQKL